MATTNTQSCTNIHEIAAGIYRINTPMMLPGDVAFSFNQYLIDDDEPLLFHTGLRQLFPLVNEAVASVLPAARLRHIAFSHVEADECGALNQWLAAAPQSVPLCGTVAAMVSVNDLADRAPRALADGEVLSLGHHRVRWFDAPHLPHGWDCGFLMEETTGTLLCGDLFTQPGRGEPALTGADIPGEVIDERSLPCRDGHVMELEHRLAQARIGEGEQLHVIARRGLALDELIGRIDAELRLRRPRRRAPAQPREFLAQEVLAA